MDKQELLQKLDPIIDRVIELVSRNDEEALVGRVVMLTPEVEKMNTDAMLELALLGYTVNN